MWHTRSSRSTLASRWIILLVLGIWSASSRSQPPPSPTKEAVVPPQPQVSANLTSPRATVETLLFAVDAYGTRPELIAMAQGCFEPLPGTTAVPGESVFQLAEVLSELTIPLNSITVPAGADTVQIWSDGGNAITLRAVNKQWRFDESTTRLLPQLLRAVQARHAVVQSRQVGLRPNATDARTTMNNFLREASLGNFDGAADFIDLSGVTADDRRASGAVIAHRLAFVIQRRGYFYSQEVPNDPDAMPYTWRADASGRVQLERLPQSAGKDAWLFSRETVANLERMYTAVKDHSPDIRYAILNQVVPTVQPTAPAPPTPPPPEEIPEPFRSPRSVMKGFLAAVDDGQTNDARMADAVRFLELDQIAPDDRQMRATRLANWLELILRGVPFSLDDLPDTWNAQTQVLNGKDGLKVEIVRTFSGWRFSEDTVARIPVMYQQLPAEVRRSRERREQFGSPRETMYTFLSAANRNDWELAARCLNLSSLSASVRPQIGPVLAAKLKYVLDRLGRIYLPSIPNDPSSSLYIHYRGDLGRITIGQRASTSTEEPVVWQFTPETITHIEPMFRECMHRPVPASEAAQSATVMSWWEQPGLWLRLRMPDWSLRRFAGLDLYQYLGLPLIVLVSLVLSRVAVRLSDLVVSWVLRLAGVKGLSRSFVSDRMRPLTWVVAIWPVYMLLQALDLPLWLATAVLSVQTFILSALIAWALFRFFDLIMAAYVNSEKLFEQRSLSEMVVPTLLRALKVAVVVLYLASVVYQLGGEAWLVNLLAAFGVVGIAASLAAQDTLKNFFGTITLIGDRPFRIGDWVVVGTNEGVVEELGFRSTVLRTFHNEVLTIPNSLLVVAAIINKGGKAFRVSRSVFSLDASLPAAKVTELSEMLRRRLLALPGIATRKVSVQPREAREGQIPVTISLVYLAPDDSAEERIRGLVLETTRSVAQANEVIITVCERHVSEGKRLPSSAHT